MTRIQIQRYGAIKALPLLFAIMPIIHSRPSSRGTTFAKMLEHSVPRTYDPNNPVETCYEILYNSDANGDGIVKHDEYLSFVGQLSEGEIEATNYIDLPFVIKINFVYLSCLCMYNPENQMMGGECCQGVESGLDVSGAGPGETPTAAEDDFLTTICRETQGAIDFVRGEATLSPTDIVTKSPTAVLTRSPSTEPTIRPTQSPSFQPMTLTPTQSPSAYLTERPTNAPTSMSPTSNPSAKPTTIPPSPLPSTAPTDFPITSEPSTNQPTPMPSIMPIAPTSIPTTSSPSAKPTTLHPSFLPSVTPMDVTTTPVLSTKQPTTMPLIAPTQQPSTKLISRTVAPTSSLVPTLPQVRTTSAPTMMDTTVVPVPTAPTTNAPFSVGTQSPSLSSQPSTIEGEGISSPTDPGSVKTPDGDLGTGDTKTESLSTGGIAGIVIASVLVAYVALYAYASKKRKREGGDPDLSDVRNKDLDDLEAGMAVENQDQEGKDQENKEASGVEDESGEYGKVRGSIGSPGEKNSSSDTLSFRSRGSDDAADYIPQSADAVPRSPPASSTIPLISSVPPSPKRRGARSSSDDSSSCGESGWSSSAGWSSLNTGSFDAGTDDGLLPGSPDRLLATFSAAGAAGAVAGDRDAKPTSVPVDDDSDGSSEISYDDNPPIDTLIAVPSSELPSPLKPVQGQVTRDDLNAAIEAGDWAVVGATAALLADTDQSFAENMILSESEHGEHSYHSREASYSESSDSNRRAKELDRMVETGDWEGVVLAAAQFDGNSSFDGHDDQGMSSRDASPSSSKDKREIRAEVEILVRRVVPDEIDNIDEMMLQFKGREDELVETLRTMQERSLAQRARAAVQKTAKLEAKAKAAAKPRAGSISSSSEPSYYAGSGNSSASVSGDASLSTSSVSDLGMHSGDDHSSSKKTNQSSLELAIGRGDWRAVGEAAAILGSGIAAPDESGDSADSYSESLSKSQDRGHYLDAMIAKGDWAGIVHAAATYQAMDDQGVGGILSTEEEREALAQASMWQEIARQSKTDSSFEATKGAVDAADWAISLARKRMEDKHESLSYIGLVDELGETDAKKPRIQDDESV